MFAASPRQHKSKINTKYGFISIAHAICGLASQELVDAAEADATFDVLKEKEEAVVNIDSLIHNAFKFMSDIDEELSKAEDSLIKIDYAMSEKTGVTHITLKSVDQWAKKKYGISILDNQEQHLSLEGTEARPTMQDKEEDLDTKDGLKRRDAESLLTTFAFLIDALFKEATKNKSIKFGEEKPNVMAIAKHIEELARIANSGETLRGQRDQSIKKRINRAMEVKKEKLPVR